MFRDRILRLIILLFLFNLIVPYIAASAERKLYLVNGCPTPKSDAKFSSSIYGIDASNKSLVLIRNVITEKQGTVYIHPYYDERIIIIESLVGSHKVGNRSSKFALIDMNQPQTEKSFEINYPETFLDLEEGYLLNIPLKGLYQSIYIAGEDPTKSNKLLGINLSTMKQEELSWDDYKYTVLSGIPGGATSGGDRISLYARSDGRLLIPTINGKKESNWQLPSPIKFAEKDRIVLFINNNSMLTLSSLKTRVQAADGIGKTPFHIYSKQENKWLTVEFPGGKTGVRAFGPWLAGYVADKETNTYNKKDENRRGEEMRKTGTPAIWRFKDLQTYSSGILLLYDIETNRKYSFETGHGDSEVLLVENDSVFYRVNDEIYQAKIGKNKVETGSLLVKDEVVPDIHWAFISPQ